VPKGSGGATFEFFQEASRLFVCPPEFNSIFGCGVDLIGLHPAVIVLRGGRTPCSSNACTTVSGQAQTTDNLARNMRTTFLKNTELIISGGLDRRRSEDRADTGPDASYGSWCLARPSMELRLDQALVDLVPEFLRSYLQQAD